MMTGRALYTAWVLPSEMTCHQHILVMSRELVTGVDLYTLIAWVVYFSCMVLPDSSR